MRGFRDRDFLQTREGFFFCVVGPFHPSDRVISYLKYVPAEFGGWGKGKKRFRRVMKTYTIPSLLETFSLLEIEYPHYLFDSPVYNIRMTGVPHAHIAKHFRPEEKLAQLPRTPHLDSLQEKLMRFTSFLADTSKIPVGSFGVTGSILLDIHHLDFSDFDVTIYGLTSSLAVKNALTTEYTLSNSAIQRFEGDILKAWCEAKARKHPLTVDEALQIYKRKWNIGSFENTRFSLHPVRLEQEISEKYGDKTHFPVGTAAVRAVVCESTDLMFLPAVYPIRDVEVVEGPLVSNIEEVISYESLYDNLAEVGEAIEVRGKLERVFDTKTGREHHRILVGSPEGKGREYIKLN